LYLKSESYQLKFSNSIWSDNGQYRETYAKKFGDKGAQIEHINDVADPKSYSEYLGQLNSGQRHLPCIRLQCVGWNSALYDALVTEFSTWLADRESKARAAASLSEIDRGGNGKSEKRAKEADDETRETKRAKRSVRT
jgi:hypothetical protein